MAEVIDLVSAGVSKVFVVSGAIEGLVHGPGRTSRGSRALLLSQGVRQLDQLGPKKMK